MEKKRGNERRRVECNRQGWWDRNWQEWKVEGEEARARIAEKEEGRCERYRGILVSWQGNKEW